jgi:hypothetical protein
MSDGLRKLSGSVGFRHWLLFAGTKRARSRTLEAEHVPKSEEAKGTSRQDLNGRIVSVGMANAGQMSWRLPF